MASIRVVAAAAGVLMLAVAVVARPPAKLKDSSCSTSDTYVYPYPSACSSPAELSEGYHYVAVNSFSGGLEPEYDETNATYYVRLTGSWSDEGATYVAVVESGETGPLLVDSAVYIYNAESKRALQWRLEGTDEYFLIEQEVSAITEGAAFQFTEAESVLLPCPLVYPPVQCKAYYLVSYPHSSSGASTSAGLLAYAEEGATYVKAADAGSTGDIPLVVRTSSFASPFSTIRTVTAT